MAKTQELDVVEAPPQNGLHDEDETQRILSFDDLNAVDDLATRFVPLPGYGKGNVGVRIRPLTMLELHRIKKDATRLIIKQGKKVEIIDEAASQKATILLSVVEPEFTPGQLDALFVKNNRLIRHIMEAVNKVNGFGEEEEEGVKQAEEVFQD